VLADYTELAKRGIQCGAGVALNGRNIFETPAELYGNNILRDCSIGAYTTVNVGTSMRATSIGRFCSIGDNCAFGPGRHPTNWLTTHGFPYGKALAQGRDADVAKLGFDFVKPIEFGHDVWAGSRSCVMEGVRIQHGAIVALGAVVTKDVPPYAIVAGVPARVVKYRFPEKTIARLLAFRWWQFDLPAAADAGLAISWNDPERALDQLEEARLAYKLPLIGNRAIAVNGAPA